VSPLLLGLVLSAPGELSRTACAELSRGDLEFTDAVEEFVRESDRNARPPEPFLSLLGMLGAPCYRCRNLAARRLRDTTTDESIRWLFWGRRSADPEIRLRSNNLLRDLTRCPICGGRGVCLLYRPAADNPDGPCENCGQWSWRHFDEPHACGACGGFGSAWVKGTFD
jgi:hypothetical protein